MNERGWIISFDAVLALMVMLVLFVGISFYVSGIKHESLESIRLQEFTFDVLSVLEKSGKIEEAVKGNDATELKRFIEKTQSQYCLSLELYSSDDMSNAVISVNKSDCGGKYSELVSVKRSFLVKENSDLNFYLAKAKAWVKEE
ncbi:hypothetical protein KJ660_00860 [Candidatus Micrarchaeota archaeon]|nr:hypothetical protein [Candidatus Micrarchaeota archaeon]